MPPRRTARGRGTRLPRTVRAPSSCAGGPGSSRPRTRDPPTRRHTRTRRPRCTHRGESSDAGSQAWSSWHLSTPQDMRTSAAHWGARRAQRPSAARIGRGRRNRRGSAFAHSWSRRSPARSGSCHRCRRLAPSSHPCTLARHSRRRKSPHHTGTWRRCRSCCTRRAPGTWRGTPARHTRAPSIPARTRTRPYRSRRRRVGRRRWRTVDRGSR